MELPLDIGTVVSIRAKFRANVWYQNIIAKEKGKLGIGRYIILIKETIISQNIVGMDGDINDEFAHFAEVQIIYSHFNCMAYSKLYLR